MSVKDAFIFSVRQTVFQKNSNNNITSIERKPRMPHIRGIKGEAVVVYCEPLITKEMGYYRLSRRVNKNEIK
jgi:hypothetical protein